MGMEIELELPDWATERNIRILAGVELVAVKLAHEKKFKIKTSRCNFCGKCCMDVRGDHLFGRDPETGNCRFLQKNGDMYECSLGIGRPFSCCASIPSQIPECTEKFEEVE